MSPLTVSQAAKLLKLHPKTVLRHIRAGRLNATRIGKSYRIDRSDLQSFVGAPDDVPRARTTAILEVADIAPEEAMRLANSMGAVSMGRSASGTGLQVSTAYDPSARQFKLVAIGSPGDTAGVLQMAETVLEQGR